MAVTMRDIAKEANVALSTVSYVLSGNGLHKVGEKTCKRILDTQQNALPAEFKSPQLE